MAFVNSNLLGEGRSAAIIALIVSLVMTTYFVAYVLAQNDSVDNVFSVNSKPYNLTYVEWSARWWTWILSIPEENNPVTDQTGKNCAVNQEGPVWFLAGTMGGSTTRQCSIPAGKAILVTPLSHDCSYAEFPAMKTEKELRECATSIPSVASVSVKVDGVMIPGLDKFRVQSPIFDVVLPENNIFGAPAGPTEAISDGWWILLKPLFPGKHTVYFSGNVIENPTTGTQSFATEVTYQITVQ